MHRFILASLALATSPAFAVEPTPAPEAAVTIEVKGTAPDGETPLSPVAKVIPYPDHTVIIREDGTVENVPFVPPPAPPVPTKPKNGNRLPFGRGTFSLEPEAVLIDSSAMKGSKMETAINGTVALAQIKVDQTNADTARYCAEHSGECFAHGDRIGVGDKTAPTAAYTDGGFGIGLNGAVPYGVSAFDTIQANGFGWQALGATQTGGVNNAPPDSDKDGVGDGLDQCANAAETFNGVKDDDGCPDTAPAQSTKSSSSESSSAEAKTLGELE